MRPSAREIIHLLRLKELPQEGGYYREFYRASGRIPEPALPGGLPGPRALSTAILYLLTPETFSHMHRLLSDEVYHFYSGDPVEMLLLEEGGAGRTLTLGQDLAAGQQPVAVVEAGVWQGSRLIDGGQWALLGTTVSPGFEFSDYQHGDRQSLLQGWPDFHQPIMRLTR